MVRPTEEGGCGTTTCAACWLRRRRTAAPRKSPSGTRSTARTAEQGPRGRRRPAQDGAAGAAVAEQPRPLLRPGRLRGARGAHLRADAGPAVGPAPAHHRGVPVRGQGPRLFAGQLRRRADQAVEWSEGTLFAPPRWAWHQHSTWTRTTPRIPGHPGTGLLWTMRLHNIERHSVQLSPEDGAKLLREAIDKGTVHGRH